jgi:hypothetical protein
MIFTGLSKTYAKKMIIAIWVNVLAIAPIFLISGSLELLLQKSGLLSLVRTCARFWQQCFFLAGRMVNIRFDSRLSPIQV